MQIALDTNILVYYSGLSKKPDDDAKIYEARRLIELLAARVTLLLPTQVCGEFYNVAVRFGRTRDDARAMVNALRANFATNGSDDATLVDALDLATDHKLQFWDALIINAAADAGCTLLLSEDMQSGFAWRGVTIVNPFANEMDRRFAKLLAQ